MDLLIILTYVAFAWAIFKIFRIPVNQWTLATATLGGVFIVAGLILLMNYNHPYTFTAQKAVISIPITPQVTGVVSEVTDKNNQLIKKGEVLFKLDLWGGDRFCMVVMWGKKGAEAMNDGGCEAR